MRKQPLKDRGSKRRRTMKTKKTLYMATALASIGLALAAMPAKAQTVNAETEGTLQLEATGSVQNTLSVAITNSEIDFGTVAVPFADPVGDPATLVMTPSSGAITNNAGTLGNRFIRISAGNGTPAEYTLSDGAPDMVLDYSFDPATVTLECDLGACVAQLPDVAEFTLTPQLGGTGVNTGDGTVTLTNLGVRTIFVGGTLASQPGANPYYSGDYVGAFDVVLTYQ